MCSCRRWPITASTISDEETFAKGDVDFNAQLTAPLSNNPDALVVSALAAEAVQIINQARQQGYAGPIIGGNGFNSPAVLNQAGDNAEGLDRRRRVELRQPEPQPRAASSSCRRSRRLRRPSPISSRRRRILARG